MSSLLIIPAYERVDFRASLFSRVEFFRECKSAYELFRWRKWVLRSHLAMPLSSPIGRIRMWRSILSVESVKRTYQKPTIGRSIIPSTPKVLSFHVPSVESRSNSNAILNAMRKTFILRLAIRLRRQLTQSSLNRCIRLLFRYGLILELFWCQYRHPIVL